MKGFEWDNNKNQANLEKHGIDFIDVTEMFDDYDRLEAEIKHQGEIKV